MVERLERVAIVLSLIDSLHKNNSWCGETHIQKATYFLQEFTKVPTEFYFILYKHGPFSFDLRDELTSMRADGLLDIHLNPYPYGPSLYPGNLYEKISNRFIVTIQTHEGKINSIAKFFRNKGVAELERISTALYVMRQYHLDEIDEVASRIIQLKPFISFAQAKNAVQSIKKFPLP